MSLGLLASETGFQGVTVTAVDCVIVSSYQREPVVWRIFVLLFSSID